MLRSVALCIVLLLIIIPASGAIITFIPGSDSISSLDVKDIAESHDGMIAFATANGLSLFDSDWATIQAKPWEYDTGLQDDYIQALEFDNNNNIWLGFAAGLQISNGTIFSRIGTNEFFNTMDIHDILRDEDTIWIANGNSGLSHFTGGRWIWMRPFTENGPGAYYITSMAKDHATGNIILTTRFHGVWKGVSDQEGITFSPIPYNDEEFGTIEAAIDHPFGGVILFNKNHILYYSESSGICLKADTKELGYGVTRINDVALTENGTYVIGTNNGLYGLSNDEITIHIARNIHGITSDEVVKVFPDSKGRWWFITKGETGYYFPEQTPEKIPVTIADDVTPDTPKISGSSVPLRIPVYYSE
ncbi:ligand-binding sensor domain-containing protein [Methanogenium organophilum]|uniref:Uncharacterized protein n=1 Tax=Methanogenium organophilum TaxID=2199 RepID=A0A9X9S3X2_METOG|nr:hypothetical protein [Methanogenium organophilum]WAI01033.1 hypothetical protein OU421_11520 [Methanogenium organophilum]